MSAVVATGPGRRKRSRWRFRGNPGRILTLLAALLMGLFARGADETHTVPHVPSAAAQGHAGLVRIESRSAFPGAVRIVAVDDAGQRTEAGELTLSARAAAEFNVQALELGDATLGLPGTGPGEGGWRLELTTELDIEARAYARSDGLVTALHDAWLVSGEELELPLFHASGEARQSALRLVNAGGEPAAITIRGVDDEGITAGTTTVELGPWEARSYSGSELEGGSAAGLSGSLGDGAGKWRLLLSAERGSAYATNLLLDGSGTVSSVPGGMSRGGFHRVPLFPSAADSAGSVGVVRVVNRTPAQASVSIEAFDATDRLHEGLRLALGSNSSAEFDSADLEHGNAGNGLSGSTGPGEGNWWLELSSGMDIEVLSYLETASGMLSPVRGTAGIETESGMRYEALLRDGSGELRLLNANGEGVEVRVSGVDDAGETGQEARLLLEPWSARTLTAAMLTEDGAPGMVGALGAGAGSWRLTLEADGEIDVLSLARGANGALSDVSRRGRPAGSPPPVAVVEAAAAGSDLRVTVSTSNTQTAPGEAFDLGSTVGNHGSREAAATTLRYYRSVDAAITAADTEIGTAAVAALAPGATVGRALTLNAPPAPGTYYYGACADAVPEETNTDNNCSAAVSVAVTVVSRPDLTVAVAGPKGEVGPGEGFELSATVRNAGRVSSPATTLRYYRSADASISTSDAELGTDSVAALAAGAESAESLTLNAPSASGAHYYGACVDAVPEEANSANNCSGGVRVRVGSPQRPLPNCEVLTWHECSGRHVEREGETMTAVRMRFTFHATQHLRRLHFYTHGNGQNTLDADLNPYAVVWVGEIPAGQSSSHTIDGFVRSAAPTLRCGMLYYRECVRAPAGTTFPLRSAPESASTGVVRMQWEVESDTTDNRADPIRN